VNDCVIEEIKVAMIGCLCEYVWRNRPVHNDITKTIISTINEKRRNNNAKTDKLSDTLKLQRRRDGQVLVVGGEEGHTY